MQWVIREKARQKLLKQGKKQGANLIDGGRTHFGMLLLHGQAAVGIPAVRGSNGGSHARRDKYEFQRRRTWKEQVGLVIAIEPPLPVESARWTETSSFRLRRRLQSCYVCGESMD